MNIVQSGASFQIYKGEDLKTYPLLPMGTYEVQFHQQKGFFLTSHEDLDISEKIYGTINDKIKKVVQSFNLVDRNFGIILSGKKGSGKSLFARKLSQEIKLPVILVTQYYPGIASFLEDISQSVMVLFDEFDKTFTNGGQNNRENLTEPQAELLSLFDGVNSGKKLFVITCNETFRLNEYLIDRPGRFHYHFRLNNLEALGIEEYLSEHLEEKYLDIIPKIVNLSLVTPMTYDLLRALSFEINQGYDFDETLRDLNMEETTNLVVSILVKTKTRGDFSCKTQNISLQNDVNTVYLSSSHNMKEELAISFFTKDLTLRNGEIIVDLEKCNFTISDDPSEWKDDDDFESLDRSEVIGLSIRKVDNRPSYVFAF